VSMQLLWESQMWAQYANAWTLEFSYRFVKFQQFSTYFNISQQGPEEETWSQAGLAWEVRQPPNQDCHGLPWTAHGDHSRSSQLLWASLSWVWHSLTSDCCALSPHCRSLLTNIRCLHFC
jgi:hypothetical protein